ncbi:MAG TPA: 16S rRNA (uracil(1498)-N(3))-methyltransferase [Deltaproteobacteria bacterium]|nr:16S rRNA (uracil(1498)-N(3))-methyltransferase [Deltaproteobacteria bacterium]
MGRAGIEKMQLRRFYIEGLLEGAKTAVIAGGEFSHLKKVLRLKAGEEVLLFDGKGVELKAVIDTIGRGSAEVAIIGPSTRKTESPVEITLLQGILKGDKPEFVVQKATELGVTAIVFFETSRTVPVIKEGRGREARLKKAAIEAVKQCGRTVLPEILITDFRSALERPDSLKIMLAEEGASIGLSEVLKKHAKVKKIALLVGPEGGLSEGEEGFAASQGFIAASFGPRILRAETAAISAVSAAQCICGDMC